MEINKVDYKVRFSPDDTNNKIPRSIVRKRVGKDVYEIEICSQYQSWKSAPEKISCWMGSSDDGWFSPPDGDDMPHEFIEKWLNNWRKNW